ncbi:MAG: hypothetical protein LBS28_05390 [Streptococcaceae bacterium]|jgi:hypothetical protein|nr:hypothetical protein [Streptococcaceae bacterium]
MGNVFIKGQAMIAEDDFFNCLNLAQQYNFRQEIINFLNQSGFLCSICNGSDLIRTAFNTPNPYDNEIGKALIYFFNMLLPILSKHKPTFLNIVWNTLGGISRNCQGVFCSRSEAAVDQEMENICSDLSRKVSVPNPEGNLQASLNAICDEIINHRRMVIVEFESSVDKNADNHCCVAFAVNIADDDKTHKVLHLYNPWGNLFKISLKNPVGPYDIGGLKKSADNCNIFRYTIFNY